MIPARVTLPALIAEWARVVDGHATDVPTANDTWCDDLLVRHAIAERLRERSTTAETRDLLAELDAEFREATEERESCVLGDDQAVANGWTRRREWYFWRARRRS